MFSDPQTLTFTVGTADVARTSTGDNSSEYASSDRSLKMRVFHTYGKRTRHVVRLQKDSLVANPLVSGQNINQSMSVYLTIDTPPGYDVSDAQDVTRAIVNFLYASTGANVAKVLGGES